MKKLGLILLTLAITSPSYAYDVSSLNGTINCTSTINLGPVLGSNYPAIRVAGSITLVADGQGNYTSGSATYEFMLNNTNMACYYNLLTGSYSVYPDGDGQLNDELVGATGERATLLLPNHTFQFDRVL